ncbi:MAG: hypothetical protein KBT31_02140, partial [Firmicutes bacterium]|nr:hypothetical protein [Candidatus Colimorpha enterica]
YNTATIDALIGQAWTEEEYAAISEQVKNLVGIREYAGQYIVKTYVDAAFLQARSNNSDASDELLDRVILINKELARKRDDFKMDYIDPNTGKWVPGRFITEMPAEAAGLVEVD